MSTPHNNDHSNQSAPIYPLAAQILPSQGLLNSSTNNSNPVLDNTDPQKIELLEAIMKGLPTPLQDDNAAPKLFPLAVPHNEYSQGSNMGRNTPVGCNSSCSSISDDEVVILSQGNSSLGFPEPSTESHQKQNRKRKFSDNDNPLSQTQTSQTAKSRIEPHRKISAYFHTVKLKSNNYSATSSPSTSSTAVQTDMLQTDIDHLRNRIHELETILSEKNKILIAREKELLPLQHRFEKCFSMMKESLMIDCRREKDEANAKSLRNRVRLGYFSNERQGTQFVEKWTDGVAFIELNSKRIQLASARENLDREKKILIKKKSSFALKTQPKNTTSDLVNNNYNSNINTTTEFATPGVSYDCGEEVIEQEEILKLRSLMLKKEEQDIMNEQEKLERERNLSIREMKRLTHEKASRFTEGTILNNRYMLLFLIGKGGFSEVHKAYDLHDMRYVACKVHQLHKDWKEEKKANYIKHSIREYNIHKTLCHPRVVKFYDVFEIDENTFCTVLEYVDGHDLDFILKQQKCLSEKEAKSIIMQTMRALKYLNEIKPPVIHYDLKPGNILLSPGDAGWEIKLTDFGLSKIVEQDGPDGMELTSQGAGTYWYLPPETFVISKEPPMISNKVDVWSVGVIFYQCLFGKKPFGNDLSQASILKENTILRATEVIFPEKKPVSKEAREFIKRCLSYSKYERPDVLTLCNDPYIKATLKK